MIIKKRPTLFLRVYYLLVNEYKYIPTEPEEFKNFFQFFNSDKQNVEHVITILENGIEDELEFLIHFRPWIKFADIEREKIKLFMHQVISQAKNELV